MRTMPCMAGCAGPMFTCRCSLPPPPATPSPRNSSRVVRSLTVRLRSPRLRPRLPSYLRSDQRLAPVDRVVLAERVTDELLVEEQPPKIRMTLEADPEHVPHLALEPVGDRPEPGGRRHP